MHTDNHNLFSIIDNICSRPKPFEFYTAPELWTDEYTSEKMLSFHLNADIDAASRKTVFIEKSVEWIAGHFGVGKDTRIADFGCGPGLYANRLASRGARVTGIDFSKRSISYASGLAEREGLNVEYVNRNYLEYESGEQFDLILMIMCDFCALSPDQRKSMLKKFRSMLKPDGRILLDAYSLTAFSQWKETSEYELNQMNGFWSPNRYYGFLNTFKYKDEKLVLNKHSILEPDRIRTVYNWFQCFSPEVIEAEFIKNGLRIIETYSDVAGTPFDILSPEFAIVACKSL